MDLVGILNRITDDMAARPDRGRVASYIPQLACIDPDHFAISICLADGTQLSSGDATTPFSIQSVSKVFGLAIALGRVGDNLWARVGREPSGQAFDSILLLEQEKGRPRNPFINAGAIVTTDTYLEGHAPAEALGGLMRFIREAADDENIHIDDSVARSEIATGHRNFALAHYMLSHGNLRHEPELTLGTYFHQCAVAMSTSQLARAGRFLMNAPDMPRMLSPGRVRRINALMLTCGQYDGSGDFAYSVGLPGKSGVGGGILVIAPGQASIAVWSPGLNDYGNSHLGTLAVETLARETGWSIFG